MIMTVEMKLDWYCLIPLGEGKIHLKGELSMKGPRKSDQWTTHKIDELCDYDGGMAVEGRT